MAHLTGKLEEKKYVDVNHCDSVQRWKHVGDTCSQKLLHYFSFCMKSALRLE